VSWQLHSGGGAILAPVDERFELIRRAYATFNEGELDLAVFHPEICVVQTSSIVGTAGEFHGYDGLRRSWDELLEGFDPVSFEPEKYDELEDGRLLVRCRWTGRGTASGIEMDAPVWHLWSFRDGLLSRMEVYGSKREALAAATGRVRPS
jgi:2-(1,2-epoxy-1,2-dihydrophenyl)acetyl-CoA isomerase